MKMQIRFTFNIIHSKAKLPQIIYEHFIYLLNCIVFLMSFCASQYNNQKMQYSVGNPCFNGILQVGLTHSKISISSMYLLDPQFFIYTLREYILQSVTSFMENLFTFAFPPNMGWSTHFSTPSVITSNMFRWGSSWLKFKK